MTLLIPDKTALAPASGPLGNDALRIAFFYAALFLIIGSYMAYLPVWLKWRGMSEAQISAIFALPLIMRIIFTPAVSYLADKAGNRRALVFWLAHGGLASLLLLVFEPPHFVIFIALTLYALFSTSIMPLTETIAMAAMKRSGHEYGRMRLWGSLSFIVAVAGGGVIIDFWGPESALWLVIAASACTALGAYALSKEGAPLETGLAPLQLGAAALIFRSRNFLIFLAATGAVSASHAVYNTLATIHWMSLGISPSIIGLLWGAGVIAEIALFAYSAPVMARIGPAQLIAIGAGAALLRWTATAFDPPLYILFPLQLLHALSFGAAHLGAIHFLARAVPERYAATGQGLYAAVAAGIAMGAAYVAAGPLYLALGAYSFFVMAGLAALSLALSALLAMRWNGGLLISAQPQSAGLGGSMKAAE